MLMTKVRSGLEQLLDQPFRFFRGRAGLITNHSAVTPNLTHILDALLRAGVEVGALFGPEHGVRGEVADGQKISSSVDARTGIVVHSLYGTIKKPIARSLPNARSRAWLQTLPRGTIYG